MHRLIWVGLLSAAVCQAQDPSLDAGGQQDSLWLSWRGPLQSGFAPDAEPPLQWSDTNHVQWKFAVPGRGHSTPIVLADRVIVTAAVPVGEGFEPRFSGRPGAHDNLPVTHRQQFVAFALGRDTGRLLWRRMLYETEPHEGAHYTASLASHSPVSDGQRIVVSFGSHGLFCLDLNGKVLWQKQLGEMHTKHGHGEGASPVLAERYVVVNWDHEGQSFLVAFDKFSGEQIWKRARREVTSWATPIVIEQQGKQQLVVSGTQRVRGYDLQTGETIWECGGMSANIVASPVSRNGIVFAGSSYEKRALLAIDIQGARGDLTATKNVLWDRFRGTPYVPSPLLYEDALYFLTHYQGILTRVDANTGRDAPGAFRLGGLGNIYASPVGAAGRVYVTDLRGDTLVISHDANPRVLARNRLGEPVSASAALAGTQLFLRGDKHLFCLQNP